MTKELLMEVLRMISEREGIDEKKILSEMEHAISVGYDSALKEGDLHRIQIWTDMSECGKPSVLEFLSFASRKVYQTMAESNDIEN